jgi:hypothetical protein
MRAEWAAAVFLTMFAPAVLYGEALPLEFFTAGQSAPINSLAFARRDPLPGQPSYLQTVKYIDDGLRYIDPWSQFFISPAGEMCFRTRPYYPTIYYNNYYRIWCIYPQSVDRVEAGTGFTFHEVRLWCMHAYPQCAHSFDEIADSISAPTIDYRQERDTLETLIYLMGGNVRPVQPAE